MLNNKKIILILAVAALLIAGAVVYWHQLPSYPQITQPTPLVSLPSPFIPMITSSPVPEVSSMDTRSWGERFRNPTIPEVPGITWQTYTNKEFGFEMEYSKGMEIGEGKSSQAGSPYIYHIDFFLPSRHPFSSFMSIGVSPKSLREIFQEDLYRVYRHKLENMIPDATTNGLGIFTANSNQSPDSNGSNALVLYFEKYGNSYMLDEPGNAFNNAQDYKIIEHMIKSLHFLK